VFEGFTKSSSTTFLCNLGSLIPKANNILLSFNKVVGFLVHIVVSPFFKQALIKFSSSSLFSTNFGLFSESPYVCNWVAYILFD
jgi:hypothetical protein